MIRRLNFTRRRRINQSDVQVRLWEENGQRKRFRLTANSKAYSGLPEEAQVCVEAYYKNMYTRYDIAPVHEFQGHCERQLEEGYGDFAFFRLKIVGTDERGRGRILACADQIRPRKAEEEKAEQESLLPVSYVNMGEEVWRLDYENGLPVLEVNERLKGTCDIRDDPSFCGLVFPAALKEILSRILLVEKYYDVDGSREDWQCRWLRLACSLPEVRELPAGGEFEQIEEMVGEYVAWVGEVIQAFCRKHQMTTHLLKQYDQEG